MKIAFVGFGEINSPRALITEKCRQVPISCCMQVSNINVSGCSYKFKYVYERTIPDRS
jgi:hypothetical protein